MTKVAPVTSTAGGRIIAFYSYKGGTGRTMLMANVAWILASQGKRVLAVDWDLEAPGLHRYYHPFLIDAELTDTDGIIDMVLDYATAAVTAGTSEKPSSSSSPASSQSTASQSTASSQSIASSQNKVSSQGTAPSQSTEWYRQYADVQRYACSLEHDFAGDGALDVLPAGRQTFSYSTRVNTFDWRNFYERQGGGAFLEAVKERMRATYDYILIDSRTGVSDTSGICTVQMPDDLVVCFTLNNQSIEGASGIATSVREQRKDPDFRIFPVPTRVDMSEKDKLEQRRALCRSRFALFPGTIEQGSEREEYWGAVEMPYVPYYAYEEILSTVGDRPGQTTSLLAAAERLTSYLTNGEVRRAAVLKEPERLTLVARYAPRRPDNIPLSELAREAERIYGTLDARQQECTRRLMTRLVRAARPNEGQDVAISAPVSEVGNLLPDSHAFVTAGVVVIDADADTGAQVVRYASPELVTSWPRLHDWMNEDRGFLAWQEQVRYKRSEWQPSRENNLLLTGKSLDTALDWVRRRGDALTQADRDYISRSARERRDRRMVRAGTVAFLLLISGSIAFTEWRSSRRARAIPLAEQAIAFDALGQRDSASAYFERALAFDPQHVDALEGLAQVRLDMGDPQMAIELLGRALALDSGSAATWASRGSAYALAGRLDLAIADYNRAIGIDSAATDVRFNRAASYEAAGDSARAIADFLQLLDTGDAPTRQAATARLERLGVQTTPVVENVQPRIYIHYTAAEDLRTVQEVARTLRQTFDVQGIERRTEPTQGDVRSFHTADADVAENVAVMVEKALAGTGYPLRLRRLRPDSTRYRNVPRGQIEVWLPSLSTPVFRK